MTGPRGRPNDLDTEPTGTPSNLFPGGEKRIPQQSMILTDLVRQAIQAQRLHLPSSEPALLKIGAAQPSINEQ